MDRQTAKNALIRYLASTQGFASLKKARVQMNQNPQAKSMFMDFQKKSAFYASPKAQAQRIMEELNADYDRMLRIPALKEYFQAAEQFSDIVNEFMKEVNFTLEHSLDTQ